MDAGAVRSSAHGLVVGGTVRAFGAFPGGKGVEARGFMARAMPPREQEGDDAKGDQHIHHSLLTKALPTPIRTIDGEEWGFSAFRRLPSRSFGATETYREPIEGPAQSDGLSSFRSIFVFGWRPGTCLAGCDGGTRGITPQCPRFGKRRANEGVVRPMATASAHTPYSPGRSDAREEVSRRVRAGRYDPP